MKSAGWINVVIEYVTCLRVQNPLYVLNRLYFNASVLLLITGAILGHKEKDWTYQGAFWSFGILLLNSIVLVGYSSLTRRGDLLEESSDLSPRERKKGLEKTADKTSTALQENPLKIPTYDARREPVDATDDRVLRTLRSIPKLDMKNPGKGQAPKQ